MPGTSSEEQLACPCLLYVCESACAAHELASMCRAAAALIAPAAPLAISGEPAWRARDDAGRPGDAHQDLICGRHRGVQVLPGLLAAVCGGHLWLLHNTLTARCAANKLGLLVQPPACLQGGFGACCTPVSESKLSDKSHAHLSTTADASLLLPALRVSVAVALPPAAGDDGFAFSPPVPPTANGSVAPGAARKQLYGPVLSQLRGLMVARMAKPEVRPSLLDTDVLLIGYMAHPQMLLPTVCEATCTLDVERSIHATYYSVSETNL